eukprot:3560275-Alexandrium_andersonii.AAC.1
MPRRAACATRAGNRRPALHASAREKLAALHPLTMTTCWQRARSMAQPCVASTHATRGHARNTCGGCRLSLGGTQRQRR